MNESPNNGALWTDAQGRAWSTAVNVNTVKRAQQLTGVNLLQVFDGDLLNRLADDPVLLVNTLYAVCKPQAEERQVSEEAFGELLVGDAIEKAAEALVRGIIDFFPKGRRPVLDRLWTKTQGMNQAALELLGTKIDSAQVDQLVAATLDHASREFDSQVQKELAKLTTPPRSLVDTPLELASGSSSGNWPASSESSPVP